ncbi:MAG: metal-dependent hydrolase [Phototrophicales bacterium]|nr:MAG: metal-dependent hydrolase [Phototrophicales bacterium]
MATKITWIGHSAFSIQTEEHLILIDPFISGNPVASVDPESLKPSFILLTHGHGDHVGDTVAIAKRSGATVFGNFEVANWIAKQGVQNTVGGNTGGTAKLAFGTVQMTIAFHSSTMPDGSDGGSPNGLYITLNNGLRIYHAGDTALFSDMSLIGEKGIDLAIVPIGDFFTMGPADAIRAVQLLRPRFVMPAHYNTFPPIQQDVFAWAAEVNSKTLSNAIVLDPGSSYELQG